MSNTGILDLDEKIESYIVQEHSIRENLEAITNKVQEIVNYVDIFQVSGCDGKPYSDYPINYRGLSHPFFYSEARIMQRVRYSEKVQESIIEDILDIRRYMDGKRKTREYYLRVELLDVNRYINNLENKLKILSVLTEDVFLLQSGAISGDLVDIIINEKSRITECELKITEYRIFMQDKVLFLNDQIKNYDSLRIQQLRKNFKPAFLIEPSWIKALKEAFIVDPESKMKPYRLQIQQNQLKALRSIIIQEISLNMTEDDFYLYFLQSNGKPVSASYVKKCIHKDLSDIEINRIKLSLKNNQ